MRILLKNPPEFHHRLNAGTAPQPPATQITTVDAIINGYAPAPKLSVIPGERRAWSRFEKEKKLPIYEYRCLKCGHQFEKMQNITDDAVRRCEKCGDQVTRLFHPVAVHFKGSGFYATDYGKKSKKPESEKDKPSGDKDKKEKKDKKSSKGSQKSSSSKS